MGCKSFIALDISDSQGTVLMQAIPTTTQFVGQSKGTYHVEMVVELPPLIPGRYAVDLWVGPHYTVTADYVRNMLAFEVSDGPLPDRVMPYSSVHGFMLPRSSYRCSLTGAAGADGHEMNCLVGEIGGAER
jgi:lipopolysaccharide transport system ATP-binding protein